MLNLELNISISAFGDDFCDDGSTYRGSGYYPSSLPYFSSHLPRGNMIY